MNNLSKDARFVPLMNAQAAGTSDTLTSSTLDTQGYDSVLFITKLGAITATGTVNVKIRQDTDSAMGTDPQDLLGLNIAADSDDDNRLIVHDIHRPQERYLDVQVVRATANAVIDSIVAILYNAKNRPVSQNTTEVVSSEFHLSPAEGTA
jgi:hypothetical protein